MMFIAEGCRRDESKRHTNAKTLGLEIITRTAREVQRSEDQHRITITIKAVSLCHRFAIRGENLLATGHGHGKE